MKHMYMHIYIYILIHVASPSRWVCEIRSALFEGSAGSSARILFAREDDTVGNPHRAHISQFELFGSYSPPALAYMNMLNMSNT